MVAATTEPGELPLTDWINAALAGDDSASERAFEQLYDELKALAHARLYRKSHKMTLNTTALVSECYLRMASDDRLRIADRRHFLRYASRVMRSAIVDIARERQAQKRGGHLHVVRLTGDVPEDRGDEIDILAVHEALQRLGRHDRQMVEVVEMRYFGGLTNAETGAALGVTDRTVRRIWQRAQLWLADALAAHT